MPWGEDSPQAKLTTEAVVLIRNLRKKGWTQKALALKFGVSREQIKNIVNRKQWRHVK